MISTKISKLTSIYYYIINTQAFHKSFEFFILHFASQSHWVHTQFKGHEFHKTFLSLFSISQECSIQQSRAKNSKSHNLLQSVSCQQRRTSRTEKSTLSTPSKCAESSNWVGKWGATSVRICLFNKKENETYPRLFCFICINIMEMENLFRLYENAYRPPRSRLLSFLESSMSRRCEWEYSAWIRSEYMFYDFLIVFPAMICILYIDIQTVSLNRK